MGAGHERERRLGAPDCMPLGRVAAPPRGGDGRARPAAPTTDDGPVADAVGQALATPVARGSPARAAGARAGARGVAAEGHRASSGSDLRGVHSADPESRPSAKRGEFFGTRLRAGTQRGTLYGPRNWPPLFAPRLPFFRKVNPLPVRPRRRPRYNGTPFSRAVAPPGGASYGSTWTSHRFASFMVVARVAWPRATARWHTAPGWSRR